MSMYTVAGKASMQEPSLSPKMALDAGGCSLEEASLAFQSYLVATDICLVYIWARQVGTSICMAGVPRGTILNGHVPCGSEFFFTTHICNNT